MSLSEVELHSARPYNATVCPRIDEEHEKVRTGLHLSTLSAQVDNLSRLVQRHNLASVLILVAAVILGAVTMLVVDSICCRLRGWRSSSAPPHRQTSNQTQEEEYPIPSKGASYL